VASGPDSDFPGEYTAEVTVTITNNTTATVNDVDVRYEWPGEEGLESTYGAEYQGTLAAGTTATFSADDSPQSQPPPSTATVTSVTWGWPTAPNCSAGSS
jgi:hypothetical protein